VLCAAGYYATSSSQRRQFVKTLKPPSLPEKYLYRSRLNGALASISDGALVDVAKNTRDCRSFVIKTGYLKETMKQVQTAQSATSWRRALLTGDQGSPETSRASELERREDQMRNWLYFAWLSAIHIV